MLITDNDDYPRCYCGKGYAMARYVVPYRGAHPVNLDLAGNGQVVDAWLSTIYYTEHELASGNYARREMSVGTAGWDTALAAREQRRRDATD